MNLILAIEALKIYKVRHERLVQVGFVLLYLIQISPFLLPVGDPDFTPFLRAAEAFVSDPANPVPVLTSGNRLTLVLVFLTGVIGLFALLFYASLMAGEAADLDLGAIARQVLRGLPALLLLLLLSIVPLILSSLLFMIPAVILLANLYLVPQLLLSENRRLPDAIRDSVRLVYGYKNAIVMQVFFLSVLLSLPETLLMSILPSGILTSILVPQFFAVLQIFAQGRLMGLFYLYLVKKQPVVIPSKPKL
jgi:hypothetical protein